jgi:hypothetical protein
MRRSSLIFAVVSLLAAQAWAADNDKFVYPQPPKSEQTEDYPQLGVPNALRIP